MLRYLISRTFVFTLLVFSGLLYMFGVDRLSSYVQVLGIFGWSYFVWHTIVHRKLYSMLLDDDDDDKL